MRGIGEQAFKELFGCTDPVLAPVLDAMRMGDLAKDDVPDRSAVHQTVIELMISSKRIETVAQIFVAMVAVNPKQAHLWLESLFPLVCYSGVGVIARQATPACAFGLALGAFRAGVWADLNCPEEEQLPFKEALPKFIVNLITCRNELMPRDEVMEGSDRLSKIEVQSAFIQPLSKVVKVWLGKGMTISGRPADVAKIVVAVQDWLDYSQHWDLFHQGKAKFGMQIWREVIGSEFHRQTVVEGNTMLAPWARQLLALE